MATTVDPFAIPITLYRHCGYHIPVNLQDATGAPIDCTGYVFHMEITPTQFNKSWFTPPAFLQEQLAGSGASGTVFVVDEEDTTALDFATPYQWRVLARAPYADPTALVGGKCTVLDGPAMVEITPFGVIPSSASTSSLIEITPFEVTPS